MIPFDPEVAWMAAVALDKQESVRAGAGEDRNDRHTRRHSIAACSCKVLTLRAKLLIKLNRAPEAFNYAHEAYDIDDTIPDILITLGSCHLIHE